MEENKLEEIPTNEKNFSWSRVGKTIMWVVLAGAVLGGGYFLVNFRPVKIAWASLVLDRHENYLPCETLPFLQAAKDQMAKHSDVIDKMKSLGATSVTTEQFNCSSGLGFYFIKGEMVVTYQNRQQRAAIEHLIGGNFFGIAYRGAPVR